MMCRVVTRKVTSAIEASWMRAMIQLTWKHRPLVEAITIIFLDSVATLTSVRSVAGFVSNVCRFIEDSIGSRAVMRRRTVVGCSSHSLL